jgi:flagellar basal-body rod protein FlgG
MNGAFEIAAIGLKAQQGALDVIANNVANINTPSFKRSDVRFSEMIARAPDPAAPSALLGREITMAAVAMRAALALNEQGEIQRTGQAMDIAIEGDGFIEVLGPRGQMLLWRGGAMSIQGDSLLANADGLPLRAMISVPPNAVGLEIDADGMVRARMAGTDALTELGQISLVRVDDPTSVVRLDGGLYKLREDAQSAEALPNQDGAGRIMQGAIERSNVQLNDEMIRLMIVQRAYAANAQVIQGADQMMAIANGLRR